MININLSFPWKTVGKGFYPDFWDPMGYIARLSAGPLAYCSVSSYQADSLYFRPKILGVNDLMQLVHVGSIDVSTWMLFLYCRPNLLKVGENIPKPGLNHWTRLIYYKPAQFNMMLHLFQSIIGDLGCSYAFSFWTNNSKFICTSIFMNSKMALVPIKHVVSLKNRSLPPTVTIIDIFDPLF